MNKKFARRDFLKFGGLSLLSLAARPFLPREDEMDTVEMARVSTKQISVYKEPWDKSKILFQRFRDELVHIYYEVLSDKGPAYNPVWYRVWGGYVHSALLQRVKFQYNLVAEKIAEKGQVMEVTVPISQSMRFTRYTGWQPVYRLYYGSNHWVMAVDEGPDGGAWYRIRDDLTKAEYHVPVAHLRVIPPEELTPITPDLPLGKKRIEISLARQTLTAYEEDRIVLQTRISSGAENAPPEPGEIPRSTPRGTFNIQIKMPSKHMGLGELTNDPNVYVIPGVPWVCFFEPVTGVAAHGTYWHTNFGLPMSHGCVNLRNQDAKWLYRWSEPLINAEEWLHKGYGTRVVVY